MPPSVLCVGGIDHHGRTAFFEALEARGFDIICACDSPHHTLASTGIPNFPFSFDRFSLGLSNVRSLWTLEEIIARVKPDLIQCFDTKPNLLGPLAARGSAPLISTINGLGLAFMEGVHARPVLRRIAIAAHRLASRYRSATVFQNEDDYQLFSRERLLGRGRPRVIPSSGISAARFDEAAGRPPVHSCPLRAMVRGGPIIVTVTRLNLLKGIDTLLAAVPLIAARYPDFRLVLIGGRETEGPYAIAQQALLAHVPHVVTLGHRPDVPRLLRGADLFIYPSIYREGVPRALLEAGLARLPIVATDIPGSRDAVEHGRSGLLVPPSSPSELAAACLSILEDPVRAVQMGWCGRALVESKFALHRIVDAYADLYDETIQSARREQVKTSDLAHRCNWDGR